MAQTTIPSNFKSAILDMTKDLSTTFPEYSYLWSKWSDPFISETELQHVYEYCLTVYPERFFDILYQNNEIFESTNTTNTLFLPGVEFKMLFNCPDISENTQNTLWKYLQLVLFTIVGSIQDKSKFGDTMNMFDGLDENELHTKLADTMNNMGSFFQNMADSNSESGDSASASSGFDDISKGFEQYMNSSAQPADQANTPSADDVHSHLKGLFSGKIGNLAKELAEEISGDMEELLGKDGANMKSTADVLKNMMKNPTKITGLIKSVSNKLQQKMNSGEISQEELMREATDIIKNMKGMGGKGGEGGEGGDFQSMFKDMAKGMGINIPKNAKMDMNAIDRMTKESTMRDKMKARMAEKKIKEAELAAAKQAAIAQQIANYVPYDFSLEETGQANKFVFKLSGEESQEKSSAIQPVSSNQTTGDEEPKSNKKKKKNKK